MPPRRSCSSTTPTRTPVEVQTEASLAQSQAVAARVVQELKLPQSVASFQAAYTVTIVTDNVLTINVGAPSSAAAVQRASALATAFLQYRAQYARTQEQQLFAQLDQQYNAAQQRLKTLEAQVSQIPTPPSTPAQKAEYDSLQTQMGQQKQIMQYVTSTKATTKTNTNAMVTGSYVLNPATALPRSHIKGAGALLRRRPFRRPGGRHGRRRHSGAAVSPAAPPGRCRGCARRARAAQRRPVAPAPLAAGAAAAGGEAEAMT